MKSYISKKIWIIPLLGFIIGMVFFSRLPEEIPYHFDSNGNVDQYKGRYSIFLFPLISMFVLLLGNILPIIDPKKKQYKKFRRKYSLIHLMVLMLFLVIQTTIIGIALDINLNINLILGLSIGMLFIFLGVYIPKIPQNYFVGVKTIWGYSDKVNWNKTQKLGGKMFLLGGLILILGAILKINLIYPLILSIIIVGFIPIFYSLSIFIKKQKKREY